VNRIAAKHRAYAGQNLANVEGLHDVIVCPELQPDHPVDGVSLSGNHHDGHITDRSDLAGQCQPVLAAEVQIERDEVDRRLLQDGLELASVRRLHHRVALMLKATVEKLADRWVVVDDYDAGATLVRAHAAWNFLSVLMV